MSYISNDPNPGRCKNFRTITHSDTYTESLRCLDYEHVPHQCSFPEPTYVVSTVQSNIFRSSELEPKPWVKPEEKE